MPDHRDTSTLQRKLQLLDAYLDELAPLVLDARALVRAVLASLPAPPDVREKRAPYRGRAGRPESKGRAATPARKPTANSRRKPNTNCG